MIIFEDNKFEIAIATFKRPDFITVWLEKCYCEAKKRNINISIYDSSPDNNTEQVVEKFNEKVDRKVIYHRVDSSTIIGYKPMIPILESNAEYIWISGDSRYHDFTELDQKIFPLIKHDDVDYIIFNVSNNYSLPDTIYTDKEKMLHDIFVPSTCIGLSIYRTSMFEEIKNDLELKLKYDKLFRDNYGFSWLGYFYNIYSKKEYKTFLINVKIYDILNKKKTQSWAIRFCGCWVDDLCQIIDNLPDDYKCKHVIPKNTWKVMGLDSISYCRFARKFGDLNIEKYEEMINNGKLKRVTDKTNRIKFFATKPLWEIELYYYLYLPMYYMKRVNRKIIRTFFGGSD